MTELQVDPRVERFTSESRRMLIDGEWVESASGQTFETYNPSTGEVLAEVAMGTTEDVERAVRAARRAFEHGSPWRKLTPSERGRIVWKIGDLIEENAEELAELEALDNGKNVNVAKAADVALSADQFRYMAGWATKIEGNTLPISAVTNPGAEFHSYTQREPVGVVGQIIPWNFPL
ncbi:MAG: aldehyde dehydrogenase family protein, partial [Rubrobacter sp.]|nr:aldehyde dehydrogenase family protein [Rubrobacter sp.]